MANETNTDGEKSVWEFVAMVKAALHTTHDDENFEETVWEVYQVIERRIEESETDVMFGRIPDGQKEQSVKDVAKSIVDDGMGGGTVEECKLYHLSVPSGGSPSRRRRWSSELDNFNPYPYTEDDDFNPYN